MTTTTPAPSEQQSDAPPERSTRFFDWMRALDLPRRPGWLGGVCAGIAERLDIDPIIVRGIAIVAAVLGAPVFLLYSVAWLVLPDSDGGILLERLLRGIIDRAIAGIAVVFVLGLLPVAQGFWSVGSGFWFNRSTFGDVTRAFWTLVLIALAVGFVAWLARRPGRLVGLAAEPTIVPATTDDRPETVPDSVANTAVETAPASPAPAKPASGASAEELTEWRERQAAWKTEHEEWKRRQAESTRELRLARRLENRAVGRERSAAASVVRLERRRIAQLSNPRLGAAAVTVSLGVALLVGGAVALAVGGLPVWRGHEAASGVASATLVVGLAVILGAALKRRSGFLSFIAVLLVLATVALAFVPRDRQLVGQNYGTGIASSGRFAQVVGDFSIGGSADTGRATVIDVWQGQGTVDITLADGVTARVETVQQNSGTVYYQQHNTDSGSDALTLLPTEANGSTHDYAHTFGPSGSPDVTIRIWQTGGSVYIYQNFTTTAAQEG